MTTSTVQVHYLQSNCFIAALVEYKQVYYGERKNVFWEAPETAWSKGVPLQITP